MQLFTFVCLNLIKTMLNSIPVKKFIFTALALAVFTVSCKKKHSDQPVPDKPFVTDIYAVGFKITGNVTSGVYWKNGKQENIPSGLNSSISAVVSIDTYVYLVGIFSAGATYWKN